MDKSRDKLLIGFCNVTTPGLVLGIYDFDSEDFRWIDLSGLGEGVHGITEFHRSENGYWLITQEDNYNSQIVNLDLDLKLSKYHKLNDSHDVHSFIPFEDGFLVTDTAGNGINRVQILDGILTESRYWSYSEEKENVGINSIVLYNSEVYISMCGPKPEQGTWFEALIQGWESAHTGRIINISNDKIICDHLFRPHSLLNIEGTLFWLESGTGVVHSFTEKHGCRSVIELDGYLRGMTYNEKYIYVASSAIRNGSRIIDNKTFTSNNKDMHSHIYRIKRKNFETETKRLTIFGNEIRGLALIKSYDNMNEPIIKGADPVLQRIFAYEKELARTRVTLARLKQEKKALLNSKSWKFSLPLRLIGKFLSWIRY